MPASSVKGQWRIIVGAAVVSAVLSVLATLLALGYVRQKELRQAARSESLRASKAAAEAQAAANRRLRARDQAEELVGFLLDDLRDELIQLNRSDLLGAAAEKSVAYFDQLPPDLVTPKSQSRLASVLMTLSDAHYQQGNERGAIAAAQRSIEIWKRLAAAGDPDGDYTVRLGRALGELGLYQNRSGDPYAARESYLQILRLYENAPPGLKDDGWRAHGLAKAHMGLGEIERVKENYAAARTEYAKAIGHIATALKHDPNEISWLQMTMTLHNNTGVTFMHDKDYPEAEEAFQQALEPNRALIRLEPKNRRWERELASTTLNLGALLHLQKDYERAEPLLREALTLRQGLAAWDPKNARWLRQLAHAWHRMAIFQFDLPDSTNALASAQHAIAAQRRLLALEPDDKRAPEEIQKYIDKYRERLTAAGMTNEAVQIARNAINDSEANRSGKQNPSRP
jgi:tetratricopeptide (TPR) repeat protein